MIRLWRKPNRALKPKITNIPVRRSSMLELPLRDREAVGSNPGRAIPKALKIVPMATLLGARYYKASTGFSSPHKYRTANNATLTKNNRSLKKSDNNQCLYSREDRMEDWQSC